MMKGFDLVSTKERVCKEKVVIAQEIMASAKQEFSGMNWKFCQFYFGLKYYLSEMFIDCINVCTFKQCINCIYVQRRSTF